ncbi:ROK family protein [Actinomadura sp. KC345]|uniref:ROK family transcriptional regulator n=1 Tax=Actinomadura sp. KC345 TaxID=2530371 RepID=UPI00104EA23A|nr:ROK family protein [Actinomadura sp. KC345]TDC53664.1 ROK family protein [Actinomadura sp. KC345]
MTDKGTVAPRAGAGTLLTLIRTGRASTRADLVRLSGFARSTVAQRLDALLEEGLIVPAGDAGSSGGRPAETFAFNCGAGVLLGADIGGGHTRVAVTDLGAEVLAEDEADLDVADGPDAVLGWVRDAFARLLDRIGRAPADVHGIGAGVPGPVDSATGRLVSPPIMPGWDGVPVPERLARDLAGLAGPGAPVPAAVADRDVNIMALGEQRAGGHGRRDVVVVKIGMGIGAALIVGGEVYRGAQGAAGDLGHLRRGTDEPCRCGNSGCLEATAGGWAIRRALVERGYDVRTSQDIARLARRGDHETIRLVRQAGRLVGEALADVVGLFNPSLIVIGGNLAEAREPLLAGIREVVYERSQVLASRDLQIVPTTLGARAGTIGAALLVHEWLYDADRISAALG